MTSREMALKALYRVEADSAYSNIAIDNIMSENNDNGSGKALATAIFYGVLERKITLDYIISCYSKIKIEKMELPVLIILRMAVYQIVFMDKIPSFAAVNESINLAKKNNLVSATGFINAVLRATVAGKDSIFYPKQGTDLFYSVKYSCPKNLVRYFRSTYGDNITTGILESFVGRPPLTVRVNTLKTTAQKLASLLENRKILFEPLVSIENALNLSSEISVFEADIFEDGLFHVQDAASQICCKLLGAEQGDSVLDVCSAPGGKAATIAEIMQNNGKILACDLHENKLGLIEQTAKRLGISIIDTMCRDALSSTELPLFDKVLCDVPCSGIGILRRKPEIRYKRDLGMDTLPDIQYNILCNSARFVKSGGTLMYSTCTLNKKENIDNTEKFLREHPDFAPKALCLNGNITRTIEEPDYAITLFPHTCNTDGFFISTFLRR